MNVSNREEMMELLYQAVEVGALKSVIDNELRDIRIETADGSKFKINWFKNLCTLVAPGFDMWFDEIVISKTHPCFNVHLTLSYQSVNICRLGSVYSHLKDGYEL